MVRKTIWFCWLQGRAHAPDVVKVCFDSWVRENPDWEIVFIDASNLGKYVDIPLADNKKSKLTLNWYSDLIRLALLKHHGGVWVDATCYCVQPLDSWLHDHFDAQLFMFLNNSSDRTFSSWFIAAQQDNVFINALFDALIHYWDDNNFRDSGTYSQAQAFCLMKHFFNKNTKRTKYWFNPMVTKVFRYAPYFNFHYHVNQLIEGNRSIRNIIDQVIQCSDKQWGFRSVSFNNSFKSLTAETQCVLENKQVPLMKLSWKHHARRQENCVYDFLTIK